MQDLILNSNGFLCAHLIRTQKKQQNNYYTDTQTLKFVQHSYECSDTHAHCILNPFVRLISILINLVINFTFKEIRIDIFMIKLIHALRYHIPCAGTSYNDVTDSNKMQCIYIQCYAQFYIITLNGTGKIVWANSMDNYYYFISLNADWNGQITP